MPDLDVVQHRPSAASKKLNRIPIAIISVGWSVSVGILIVAVTQDTVQTCVIAKRGKHDGLGGCATCKESPFNQQINSGKLVELDHCAWLDGESRSSWNARIADNLLHFSVGPYGSIRNIA